MQMKFLEEYAKDLDAHRAAAAAGYERPADAQHTLCSNPAIRKEIESLHDVYRRNLKMTAEHASARHIEIMDKLEGDYDKSDLGTKSKFAGSLVKASESYLRAAGHFTQGGGGTESQVVINIDLGGDEKKAVTIDGEVIDVEEEEEI